MSATKISKGTYHYRGCLVDQNWDNELYEGWWEVRDLDDLGEPGEYFPTKRAAMVAIDADPPKGY